MTSAVHSSFEMRRSFSVFPKNQSLPVSQPHPTREDRLRRRSLSSAEISPPPATQLDSPWLNLRSMRSKSVGELGALLGIRRWWDWGWAWILSRKPAFGSDLEMYEHEKTTTTLRPGGPNCWSPALVLYRIRSELRRLFRSGDRAGGLPQTCK